MTYFISTPDILIKGNLDHSPYFFQIKEFNTQSGIVFQASSVALRISHLTIVDKLPLAKGAGATRYSKQQDDRPSSFTKEGKPKITLPASNKAFLLK